jgi:type IV pilus assembly protein PilN
MIRINLLPVRETKRQADVRQQGIMLAIVALAAVALCLPFHLYQNARISKKSIELRKANVELQKLQVVRDQVERYTAEKNEIETKLQVIASLEATRSGPVRIMDEIATRIPKRMWLTNLSMKAGELRLEGVSLDAEIVAAFLTGLGESPLIHGVELEETLLQETEGLKLNTFKLRSSYTFAESQESGPDAVVRH